MEYLAALTIAIGSWLGVPGGSWQPNAQDVAEARSQLDPYVARQAHSAREVLPAWDSYTFQYQGQELHGKRVILVNAFCSAPPPYAATQLVVVFDGGPCYFRAYWDPIDKIYIDVRFNGHA
jgi:hypothetical protein